MNASPTPTSPIRWFATLVSIVALSTGMLFAQAGTGTITGRVSDSGSGRSLQGAVVKAVGTTAVDVTDQDGRFTLTGLPAGTASVEVEYVGLDLFKQTVAVSAGSSTTMNAELRSEVHRM